MHRFYVETDTIKNKQFKSTDKDLCHQLQKVLKLRPGKKIVFCDNTENECLAELTLVSKSDCQAKILEINHKTDISSKKPVHLFVTPLKNQNRFELILEKCTEIGIASFTPLITERSEVESLRKPERLERIIKEAAELSGRTVLPKLRDPATFADLLKSSPTGLNLIFSLHEKSQKIMDLDIQQSPINLFIGPVGDFSEEELNQSIKAGFKSTSLGSQILRTETASIVASSLILSP